MSGTKTTLKCHFVLVKICMNYESLWEYLHKPYFKKKLTIKKYEISISNKDLRSWVNPA